MLSKKLRIFVKRLKPLKLHAHSWQAETLTQIAHFYVLSKKLRIFVKRLKPLKLHAHSWQAETLTQIARFYVLSKKLRIFVKRLKLLKLHAHSPRSRRLAPRQWSIFLATLAYIQLWHYGRSLFSFRAEAREACAQWEQAAQKPQDRVETWCHYYIIIVIIWNAKIIVITDFVILSLFLYFLFIAHLYREH